MKCIFCLFEYIFRWTILSGCASWSRQCIRCFSLQCNTLNVFFKCYFSMEIPRMQFYACACEFSHYSIRFIRTFILIIICIIFIFLSIISILSIIIAFLISHHSKQKVYFWNSIHFQMYYVQSFNCALFRPVFFRASLRRCHNHCSQNRSALKQ